MPPANGSAASARHEQGAAIYADQFEISPEEATRWFTDRVGDRFRDEAFLSAAGAWVDDELSLRDRSLVVVAALITQGGADAQLRVHARWALRHGCTSAQLDALATLLGVYAGYPRASNGLMTIREELAKLAPD